MQCGPLGFLNRPSGFESWKGCRPLFGVHPHDESLAARFTCSQAACPDLFVKERAAYVISRAEFCDCKRTYGFSMHMRPSIWRRVSAYAHTGVALR